MIRRVHLDHNATTPMRREAIDAYREAAERWPGNPSSVHASGRAARQALEEARERIAAALGVHDEEIVFTSGGTEANNLALRGTLSGTRDKLVTTPIEHSSVLEVARELSAQGIPVRYVPVDSEGFPDLDELAALADDRSVVSVMAANNEVGTLVDLEGLVARSRERGALVHSDMVQALGKTTYTPAGLDLASFSAHKIGGPRGFGWLYRRRGLKLFPQMLGGEQELGLRAGTEDVAAAWSAAVALEAAVTETEAFIARTRELSCSFWRQLQAVLPGANLNGPAIDSKHRLPNTLNVSIPGIEGRVVVTRLDLEGLECSAGSACASGSLQPSHVLKAMGRDDDVARAALRLSLGRGTSSDDVHTAVETLRRTFVIHGASLSPPVD